MIKDQMKKICLILFVLIFFSASMIFFKKDHCENNKAKIYQINFKNYCLLTAVNQKQWERGLMYYKNKRELNGADGMIFIFPDKQIRSFWNKNTYMDLDLYWMNDKMVLGKNSLPSIEKTKKIISVGSPGQADKVIEIIK